MSTGADCSIFLRNTVWMCTCTTEQTENTALRAGLVGMDILVQLEICYLQRAALTHLLFFNIPLTAAAITSPVPTFYSPNDLLALVEYIYLFFSPRRLATNCGLLLVRFVCITFYYDEVLTHLTKIF